MIATSLSKAGAVSERKRSQLIIRRAIGPPRPFNEPTVPPDYQALQRRRDPLIDRLEKLRDNSSLQLSESSRNTIDETIALILKLGWGEYE